MVAYLEQNRARGCRGQPRLSIHKEQLEYLLDVGFKIKDIALILGCCTRTIERRMSEFTFPLMRTQQYLM